VWGDPAGAAEIDLDDVIRPEKWIAKAEEVARKQLAGYVAQMGAGIDALAPEEKATPPAEQPPPEEDGVAMEAAAVAAGVAVVAAGVAALAAQLKVRFGKALEAAIPARIRGRTSSRTRPKPAASGGGGGRSGGTGSEGAAGATLPDGDERPEDTAAARLAALRGVAAGVAAAADGMAGRARDIGHNAGQVATASIAEAKAAVLAQRRKLPVKRTWKTRGDDRVRPEHKAVEGQVRPLGVPFDVGGAKLRHPGDQAAPPHLWIGCRCTLRYSLGRARG
jgi:hypothetical protein